MCQWLENPNWSSLPKPEIGDKVQLRLTDHFNYSAKVQVTDVNDDEITGLIEGLFDHDEKGEIMNSENNNKIGDAHKFHNYTN